jgi:hypothetical protein
MMGTRPLFKPEIRWAAIPTPSIDRLRRVIGNREWCFGLSGPLKLPESRNREVHDVNATALQLQIPNGHGDDPKFRSEMYKSRALAMEKRSTKRLVDPNRRINVTLAMGSNFL